MKKSNTKRALLMSALSLLLCVALLLGTTYAWFTDSVTSANNIIKSGNLDVELEYSTDMASWNTVTADSKLFSDTALWEPGYTQVVYLKVKNVGSLDLKYQLAMNIVEETPGINQDGETFKFSEYIMFGTKEVTAKYAGRAEAVNAVKANAKKISAGFTTPGTLADHTDAAVLALVVYMPEEVTSVANHNGINIPQIRLGLNLVATQFASEDDSFNEKYDELATYPAAASFIRNDDTATDELTAGEVGINLPAGAPEGTYTIEVSNKDVQEENGNTTVSYEIELLYNGQPVSTNTVTPGTVYDVNIDVGPGLNITSVLHKGQPVADFDYNIATGIVSFKTSTFSPFAVSYNVPETEWNGEIATALPQGLVLDSDAKKIYVSGAGAYTYLDTLAANWNSYVSGYNAYYYYWDWCVELLSDIDLNGKDFSLKNFIWGGFNGNGNTISNANIEGQGLFAAMGGTLGLVDLNVANIHIDGNALNCVGGVVGSITTFANNVHAKNVTVRGEKYVGGLFGKAVNEVKDCSLTEAVVKLTENGEKTVGGLIGYAIADGISTGKALCISGNVLNNVTVSGTYNVGGIVGQLQGSTDSIALTNNTYTTGYVASTKALPANASAEEKRADGVAARVVGECTIENNALTDVEVVEVGIPAPADLPVANVREMPEYVGVALDWKGYGGLNPNDPEQQLEAVYEFSAVDTSETVITSPYRDWITDYYVKLDRDLPTGDIVLGGNYGSFGWVGFNNPEPVAANTWVPLLGAMTSNGWTYQMIVDSVGTFLCGVADVDNALSGATFTVELRITNPADEAETYVVNSTSYTFE